MLVNRAGIHKMLDRIANREDPDQTASSEGSLIWVCPVCLFDLILYFPSTIYQLNRDGSSWVEPVLS